MFTLNHYLHDIYTKPVKGEALNKSTNGGLSNIVHISSTQNKEELIFMKMKPQTFYLPENPRNSEHDSDYCKIRGRPCSRPKTPLYRIFTFTRMY